MIEQELKEIWKNSSNAERIKFDLSRLIIELNNTMERIERSIKRRDRREIIGCIIGIIIFAYFFIEIPFPITKIASALVIVYFIYVAYRLLSISKIQNGQDIALSLKDQLVYRKEYLSKQARLLDSVLYWYVLPPFIMNVLFIVGLGDPSDYNWTSGLIEFLPLTVKSKVSTLVSCAILYVFVVWMNRRTVQTYYFPAIREIEHVQSELEKEGE